MDSPDDKHGVSDHTGPEYADKIPISSSAENKEGRPEDVDYAQTVDLRPRLKDAFKIASKKYVESTQCECLKQRNEQLIAYLATNGRAKLDQAVLDVKKAEAEAARRIAELADDEAVIEMHFGEKLSQQTIFKRLYDINKKTLRHFGFLDENGAVKGNGAPLPDSAAVLRSFDDEEIEIAKTFKGQCLILVPDVPFAEKIKAMNSKKDTGSNSLKACALPDLTNEQTSSEQTRGWRAYIVEYNNQADNDDSPPASCAERAQKQIDLLPQKEQSSHRGLDRHLHIMMTMDYKRRGKSPSIIGKKVLLWGEYETTQSKITAAFCISGNLVYRTLPSHLVCTDVCLGPRFVGGNIVM